MEGHSPQPGNNMRIYNSKVERMGNKVFSFLFSVLALTIIVMVLSPRLAQALIFKVEQDGLSKTVEPVKRAEDAVSFYDYLPASGHCEFMEEGVSKLYLYQDTESGTLSLIIHHHIDEGTPGWKRVDFDFDSVPGGVFVALSDDWEDSYHLRQELDLTEHPEGRWRFGHRTDGGVLSGFSTNQPWCFTITPTYFFPSWGSMEEWRYVKSDGSEFVLDMEKPVTICAYKGTPSHTQWGLILLILAVAGFFWFMIVRRRRAMIGAR